MSKTVHTPGPWMVDEDRPFDVLFDDRAGDGVTPIVASVHTDNADPTQWQADARLIAAAPELLDALKRLQLAYVNLMELGRDRIISLGGSCDPVDVMEAGDPALRSVREVLAKATGAA